VIFPRAGRQLLTVETPPVVSVPIGPGHAQQGPAGLSLAKGQCMDSSDSTDRRRALALLDSCEDGCTETFLTENRIASKVISDLIKAGLAIVKVETIETGVSMVELLKVRITSAGRAALRFELW
jgi:hypothetical protein